MPAILVVICVCLYTWIARYNGWYQEPKVPLRIRLCSAALHVGLQRQDWGILAEENLLELLDGAADQNQCLAHCRRLGGNFLAC